MIAGNDVLEGTAAESRPIAFEPDLARSLNLPERAPGWDVGPERRIDDGRSMARLLGWASLGLGALEALAPKRIADFLGIDEEHASLIRLMGAREIAQGLVILNSKDPAPGIYARIAGDALDISALGVAMGKEGSNKGAVAASLAFVAGVTAMDVICAKQLRSEPD
ncbi:MAG TPA: hypothetical protein VF039_12500 [Longimicrobiales bacterium]